MNNIESIIDRSQNPQIAGVKVKKRYISPAMQQIMLDNEISLALESTPPDSAPGEGQLMTPHYFNNDPFRNQNA